MDGQVDESPTASSVPSSVFLTDKLKEVLPGMDCAAKTQPEELQVNKHVTRCYCYVHAGDLFTNPTSVRMYM